MSENVNYVSTGKPKVGGAAFRAPAGTTLPTDATTALAAAFECVGYISEDGLTNNNAPESAEIKDWGGRTVLRPQESKADDFGFTLLEVLNPIVLKTVFGDDNVTGTLETGIHVKANAAELEEHVWVFEIIMRNGVLKRIVIPLGKITEIGEVSYKADEAVGYECTLGALPDPSDAEGNTHHEYIIQPSAGE